MRISLFVALQLVLLVSTGFTADAPKSASFVSNGGFETDKNSDQWPDGWARPKSGVSWQVEEGNHFLRLVSSRPGETVMLFQEVTLPADARAIEITWRQRITDLKPG